MNEEKYEQVLEEMEVADDVEHIVKFMWKYFEILKGFLLFD